WESLASPFFKALEEFYEMLSYGVKFYDAHTIRRFQVHEHAKNWVLGIPDKPSEIDVQTVVTGHINDWPPAFRVRANLTYGTEIIDELVKWRNEIREGLCEVFQRWKTEKDRTFMDWFGEEARAFGEVTLRIYKDHFTKSLDSFIRNGVLTEVPEGVLIVQDLMAMFREEGVPREETLSKATEYLLSADLTRVPSIKISSMLYAALARKAAGGQKRPPNRGMANDVETLCVLLPFCNAMFVIYGMLNEMTAMTSTISHCYEAEARIYERLDDFSQSSAQCPAVTTK
ncbi:MAG: hypothetical protein ACLP5H_14645, partial [Desulfomonilaceae bacterium]